MLNLANLVVAVAVCCSLLGIKGAEGSRVQDSWRRLRESGHTTTTEGTDPDFDTYTFTAATAGESSGLATEHVTGSYNSTGRHYSGFMATFHPSFFSFFPAAPDGCTALLHSTKMATADWHSSCEYATNGGFFNMDAPVDGTYCVGNLISEGKVVQLPYDSSSNPSQVGVTSDGKAVFGNFGKETTSTLGFTELISGNGWLVRNSQSYINSTSDFPQPAADHDFVTEKAPRNAVGWRESEGKGQLALLQVDGVEDFNLGPDLYEFAELAVSLGFQTLINIDGGGSAVSIQDGKVISRPTCDDTGRVCERRDANIACVKKVV